MLKLTMKLQSVGTDLIAERTKKRKVPFVPMDICEKFVKLTDLLYSLVGYEVPGGKQESYGT